MEEKFEKQKIDTEQKLCEEKRLEREDKQVERDERREDREERRRQQQDDRAWAERMDKAS